MKPNMKEENKRLKRKLKVQENGTKRANGISNDIDKLMPLHSVNTLPDNEVPKLDHIPTIRKITYDFDTDTGRISHSFWLEDDWGDLVSYRLKIGSSLEFELGDVRICQVCYQATVELDMGRCQNCIDYTSPFRTRLSCMFNSDTSPLVLNGSCSREEPACSMDKNIKYCYSRYVVYLGRIGNHVKVGISRKNRRGTFINRFVEQGLNEAIAIIGFNSLPLALETEQWFEEMGYNTAASFDKKIDQITGRSDRLSLLETWPIAFLEEKFNDKEIVHYTVYDDKEHFPIVKPGHPKHVHGEIYYVQGPLLVTFTDGICRYWDLRNILHREVSIVKADCNIRRRR